MANVVKIKSELKEEKTEAFGKSFIYLLLSVIMIIVTVVMLFFTGIKAVFLLFISLVLFLLYKKERKAYMIMSSGVDGENKVLDILRKLPNEYTVIANPIINNRGKYNELDFVVVGKNAVFTIETKNYRGVLKGVASADEVTQIKTAKDGKTFSKTIKNPIIQADMQSERMRELLCDLKLPYTVFPILYFSNKYMKLDIYNDKPFGCRIIKNEGSLLSYINKMQGETKINYLNTDKLIKALGGNKN